MPKNEHSILYVTGAFVLKVGHVLNHSIIIWNRAPIKDHPSAGI